MLFALRKALAPRPIIAPIPAVEPLESARRRNKCNDVRCAVSGGQDFEGMENMAEPLGAKKKSRALTPHVMERPLCTTASLDDIFLNIFLVDFCCETVLSN